MQQEKLTEEKVSQRLLVLTKWGRKGDSIARAFPFPGQNEAKEFAAQVKELAGSENHHPDINIKGNTVELLISTHSIKGLTEKDFILAGKIDKLQ